ncbi:FixH family protein [Halobacillus yeomjeoni]|uniref:FixH family protein n=1 Tax=Halobacillus yeomjeoni TaxID=311194 RepID=UPI001CD2F0C3|nr:FixH family protein [Halobacillus yeomjeoni]MCA0985045.1 FixH family protein [Halobacillus yeomjeoni]
MFSLFAISSVLLLAACGENTNENANESEEIKRLDVEISTEPKSADLDVGEEFTVKAQVSYGQEKVEDADEVRFEFWKKGQESAEHEMIDGEHQSDGVYTMNKKVDEPGVYYVISHVQARDQHNMPKQELMIGTTGENKAVSDKEKDDHHQSPGDGDYSKFKADIKIDDTLKIGKETTLTALLMNGDVPISEADVRFEIWKMGNEKHTFLDAEEMEEGRYKLDYTFTDSGEYAVNLHVVVGEFHTHKKTEVKVE